MTPEDIEKELPEPPVSQLDPSNLEIHVILALIKADTKKEVNNVFECAEYWLRRGYEASTG